MNAFIRTGFLALAILLAPAARANAEPFEDGVAAYQRGDYATALIFWRPLAEQGHVEAQHRLGAMYRKGLGVPQDYAAAYMWFTLAIAKGHKNAQENRGSLAKRMTHGQIEEAYLMAREWRAEHRQ